jgi:type IV pilus assembly protein PilO
MTTTRKWTTGAAVLAVLILVATWFLLVSPKRGEATQLQADTAAQVNENASLETQLSVLREQNKKLPKYQADLAGLYDQVPQTNALPGFVHQLSIAADRSGVALDILTPTPAVPLSVGGAIPEPVSPEGNLPAGQLAGINVDIAVSGGFFEIQQFANKLENLQRYNLVGGLDIGPAEGETDVVATDNSKNLLTATFHSRVFLVPVGVDPATTTTTTTTTTTADPQS